MARGSPWELGYIETKQIGWELGGQMRWCQAPQKSQTAEGRWRVGNCKGDGRGAGRRGHPRRASHTAIDAKACLPAPPFNCSCCWIFENLGKISVINFQHLMKILKLEWWPFLGFIHPKFSLVWETIKLFCLHSIQRILIRSFFCVG